MSQKSLLQQYICRFKFGRIAIHNMRNIARLSLIWQSHRQTTIPPNLSHPSKFSGYIRRRMHDIACVFILFMIGANE